MLLLGLISLLQTASVVRADQFNYPPLPDGTVRDYSVAPGFYLGESITLGWETTASTYGLEIWQENVTAATAARIARISNFENASGTVLMRWTVQQYNSSIYDSRVYLMLINGDGANFRSGYFNITEYPVSTASSSPSGSTASILTSPIPFTSTATVTITNLDLSGTPRSYSTADAAQTSAASSSQPALSGSKIGGMVTGLGLGVLLIAVVGYYYMRLTWKKDKRKYNNAAPNPCAERRWTGDATHDLYSTPYGKLSGPFGAPFEFSSEAHSELDGQSHAMEMTGTPKSPVEVGER